MITAELRINTQLMGHIYCVNEKDIPGPDGSRDWNTALKGWCEYSYEYYKPGENIIKGTVEHYRPNGAIALMKEICEDIEGKGGK